MFVISVKLNKRVICAFVALLCLSVAVATVALRDATSDVLNTNVSTSAKSTQDHILFLNAFGYNVVEKPVQIQEIIIPEVFSPDYEKYNEYQKLSGFDLSEYKNYRVKKYTYKVLDYSDSDDEVVANIIVYGDKVIGGDISSTVLGGFVHGFIKE